MEFVSGHVRVSVRLSAVEKKFQRHSRFLVHGGKGSDELRYGVPLKALADRACSSTKGQHSGALQFCHVRVASQHGHSQLVPSPHDCVLGRH